MQTTPQTPAHAREIWINKRKKIEKEERKKQEIRCAVALALTLKPRTRVDSCMT